MIKIAIVGYGNLGKGVEQNLKNHSDIEAVGVFTRRDPKSVKTLGTAVYHVDDLFDYQNKVDVCILCGSSKNDLEEQTPYLSRYFNCVDSFDIHANIIAHKRNVDKTAAESHHTSLISAGWDPGLFSMNRILFEAILPKGQTETFWGKGVSQGHSQVVRSIDGVIDAIQYTIPDQKSIADFKKGEVIDDKSKHQRHCYVVAHEKDQQRIEEEIITMPHYFADSDTSVFFISQESMNEDHQMMPHGGKVLRYGQTNVETDHLMEFNLQLDNNPEFTSSFLLMCARVVYRMNQRGDYGAKTILDVSLKDLSHQTEDELLSHYL